MNVRICIPWGETFEPAKSGLRDLKLKGEILRKDVIKYKGYTFDIEPRHGSPNLVQLRNSLLCDRGKTPLNYDWFAFIDSDIVWKVDDMVKLLEHNTEVSCAPYIGRARPDYECGLWDEMGKAHKRFTPDAKGFKRVDFCGGGFLLINRHALDKINYPYFRYDDIIEDDGLPNQSSEDFGICNQFSKAGIRIWCDFDIHIGHKPRQPKINDWNY